ncbi:conserved hypothetical protein [Ricinus communis]|uniref:SAWADEE domain-containing protein n=1 Tax=Ricinus communis TaxID=3988 RepID=B9SGN5_RICCO|nr:conserved hypothetical protein [Ricinus communis]
MEFQCPEDNAWYDVNLFCDGKELTVHYTNFSEEYDEKYDVDVFNNMEELEEFRARFRLSSVQIQDHDCKLICQVVEVLNEEHKFKKQVGGGGGKKKKKKSVCTYVVTWQHGPLREN